MEIKPTQKDAKHMDKWTRRSAITHGISEERLMEMCNAERAGRCVVLPCKVGSKIYKLFCGDILELEVEYIVCWSSGCWKVNACTDRRYTYWKGFEIDFSNFGKTVFATREEAEAAIKDMKEGQA